MSNMILITGGTSGIGLATAQLMLSQGYKVIITGNQQDHLDHAQKVLGNHAITMRCDMRSITEINSLANELNTKGYKLDGLFINAGVFLPNMFADVSEAEFDLTMDINFKGAFFTIQALIPLLNTPSSIVLNTSLAVSKAFAGGSIYSASKCALEGIAKVLSLELAPRQIRVNTIRPGITLTPIQAKAGMSADAIAAMVEQQAATPLGRILYPEDIAKTAAFLLSEQSLGMCGAVLEVNGGAAL